MEGAAEAAEMAKGAVEEARRAALTDSPNGGRGHQPRAMRHGLVRGAVVLNERSTRD